MTSCNPPYHWDGTRKGPKPTRALRIAPDSPSRLLRSARAGVCRYCGNTVEWCYRADDSPIPLHPAEVPAVAVPPRQRWHLASGIAHPTAGGFPWCRIAHTAICPTASPTAGRAGSGTPFRWWWLSGGGSTGGAGRPGVRR
ncbi:DUF6083 domain-containing protein [Kitasatospora sp. NPDC085879]|uniref:DUF6083 domain-containing protein n=1 Tax=Kitasatospora sp. NPDC085879 TaxID=3154769 RepID=UPI0034440B81